MQEMNSSREGYGGPLQRGSRLRPRQTPAPLGEFSRPIRFASLEEEDEPSPACARKFCSSGLQGRRSPYRLWVFPIFQARESRMAAARSETRPVSAFGGRRQNR